MRNCQIVLKKGVKNGRKWYAVYLHITYDSGKTYTKILDFITQSDYDLLKASGIKDYE